MTTPETPIPIGTETLVERLRARAFVFETVGYTNEIDLAKARRTHTASRIEELEGERDRLISAVGEHVTVRSDYLARLEALRPFAAVAPEYDRWQAKGSTSTPAMVRFSYGRVRIELADFRLAASTLGRVEGSQGHSSSVAQIASALHGAPPGSEPSAQGEGR